jgi:hypothetical protein
LDALIVLLVATGIWLTHRSGEESLPDNNEVTVEVKLNPTLYEDPNAFMVFANELGFN